MGYKFQFVTLAGFHALNYGMFELARDYRDEGMAAYSELQQAEFAAEKDGYTATRHQREVGTGYFDEVAQVDLRRHRVHHRPHRLHRGGAVRRAAEPDHGPPRLDRGRTVRQIGFRSWRYSPFLSWGPKGVVNEGERRTRGR